MVSGVHSIGSLCTIPALFTRPHSLSKNYIFKSCQPSNSVAKTEVLNGRGWYNSHLRFYFILDPSVPCCKRLCLLQSQFLALSTCLSPSRHFTSSRETANSEQVFRRIASRGKNYSVYLFHLELSGDLRGKFCWYVLQPPTVGKPWKPETFLEKSGGNPPIKQEKKQQRFVVSLCFWGLLSPSGLLVMTQ